MIGCAAKAREVADERIMTVEADSALMPAIMRLRVSRETVSAIDGRIQQI